MKVLKTILITTVLIMSNPIYSQTYPDLNKLEGFSLEVYYSSGHKERAIAIAKRCEHTMKYITSLVEFSPKVSLFILNPDDWKTYATVPLYGMPHYNNEEQLIVAAEDNAFWKSFMLPTDELPKDMSQKVKETYINSEGDMSMMPFFDLLVLHELGHAFHMQGGLTMQRLWMQELFSNSLLHTYIAENEPENLPALELLPEIIISKGTSNLEFTQLSDFERLYSNMNPNNYGWYQLKLHAAAKQMYNSGGKELFKNLWNFLKIHSDKMDDETLVSGLSKEVDPSVANVFLNWDYKN